MKISKYINYTNLTPELQAAASRVQDADYCINCRDEEGDFMFAMIHDHHVEECLENQSSIPEIESVEELEKLQKFMSENEIEFIQY